MDFKDVAKPVRALAGLASLAAGALTVGYVVWKRDPETVRRVVKVAAGAMERASSAWAETYEEWADLWAETREQVRQEIEDAQFEAKAADDKDRDTRSKPEGAAVNPGAPSKRTRAKRRV
jgi:hypothetical protein